MKTSITGQRALDTTGPGYVQSSASGMAAKLAINPLTPNDHYRGRTAPLTSKRCILYIYSTNIGTEYFNLLAPEFFF